MAKVDPIPAGYPALTPSIIVDGAAAAAIEFYGDVLGATIRMRMDQPDGKVGHCELQFGGSVLMLADEFPDMGYTGPKTIGGSPVTLSLYVDDVDAVFAKAIAAGAISTQAVEDKFYGDRSGQFIDPFGHRWNVGTHVEDVSPEEMDRRAAEVMAAESH